MRCRIGDVSFMLKKFVERRKELIGIDVETTFSFKKGNS